MKKILYVFLILWFFVSSTNAYTQAELDAANYISSKWIIKDNSSNQSDYRLDDSITRKETMKIVMNMSSTKVEDKCEWKFSDVVNDWWCKYIESALENGFIASNASFRPDDNITKTEAMKLIFKARGIEKTANTWDWQADYMETAFAKWLIDTRYNDFNADATRWWIFLVSRHAFDYSKDFQVLVPSVNPYETYDDLVTIEWIVPEWVVDKILVNNYQLKEFNSWDTSWKYHANYNNGNLKDWKNVYRVEFYNNDNRILLYKEIVIVRKTMKEKQSGTYTEEASIDSSSEIKLTWTVTAYSEACFYDGPCWVTIDDKYFVVLSAWYDLPNLSQDVWFYDVDYSSESVGKKVELYWKKVSDTTVSLYGSSNYYLKFVK